MRFFGRLCNNFYGGGIMMIIIFGIIAYIVYDFYKKGKFKNDSTTNVNNNSESIRQLEYLFAKGEISEEDFIRKRDIINRHI